MSFLLFKVCSKFYKLLYKGKSEYMYITKLKFLKKNFRLKPAPISNF